MPEGDTVFRQCAVLDEALAGATVRTAELRVPAYATADLAGWQVREVVPRGKHLLIRLCPPAGTAGTAAPDEPEGEVPPALTLHSHLMMDGVWQVGKTRLRGSDVSSGARAMHTARIVLEAEHGDGRRVRAIGYDVKQVRLVRTRDERELLGHLGPDLLDPAWGPELRHRATENLRAQAHRPVGLALLDQRILAGVGNIYRSELCFLSRIHPARPTSEVPDLGELVDLAHRLLMLNTRREVRITTGGMLGRDGDLWVYGRARRPCRRCRTAIRREELADPALEGAEPRSIYLCPRCQDPQGPGD